MTELELLIAEQAKDMKTGHRVWSKSVDEFADGADVIYAKKKRKSANVWRMHDLPQPRHDAATPQRGKTFYSGQWRTPEQIERLKAWKKEWQRQYRSVCV